MDLTKLTNEQLAEQWENLNYQEEEIVASKVALREEVMNRLKNTQEVWGNFVISTRTNYKFTATVEQAKLFGAVKVEEKVDSIKMKKLYLSGAKVPGEVIVTKIPLLKNITGENNE